MELKNHKAVRPLLCSGCEMPPGERACCCLEGGLGEGTRSGDSGALANPALLSGCGQAADSPHSPPSSLMRSCGPGHMAGPLSSQPVGHTHTHRHTPHRALGSPVREPWVGWKGEWSFVATGSDNLFLSRHSERLECLQLLLPSFILGLQMDIFRGFKHRSQSLKIWSCS